LKSIHQSVPQVVFDEYLITTTTVCWRYKTKGMKRWILHLCHKPLAHLISIEINSNKCPRKYLWNKFYLNFFSTWQISMTWQISTRNMTCVKIKIKIKNRKKNSGDLKISITEISASVTAARPICSLLHVVTNSDA
jgi:hypothetical protein